jgi:hypothetical protein
MPSNDIKGRLGLNYGNFLKCKLSNAANPKPFTGIFGV